MPKNTYYGHKRRQVEQPPNHAEEVYASLQPLSRRCKQAVLSLVYEDLPLHDPDLDERCCLLNDRFEVYAMRIDGCAAARLAVSIDRHGEPAPPLMVHGATMRAKADACEEAVRRAIRHRAIAKPYRE